MFKDIKVEEAIVYLMLIVVGYYIAKMFSRSCNGFSIGGQVTHRCGATHIVNQNICDRYNKVYDTSTDNNRVSNLEDCCKVR